MVKERQFCLILFLYSSRMFGKLGRPSFFGGSRSCRNKNQASRWIEIFLMAAYKSADNPTDEFPRGMQMNRGGPFSFSRDTCKIYLMV